MFTTVGTHYAVRSKELYLCILINIFYIEFLRMLFNTYYHIHRLIIRPCVQPSRYIISLTRAAPYYLDVRALPKIYFHKDRSPNSKIIMNMKLAYGLPQTNTEAQAKILKSIKARVSRTVLLRDFMKQVAIKVVKTNTVIGFFPFFGKYPIKRFYSLEDHRSTPITKLFSFNAVNNILHRLRSRF